MSRILDILTKLYDDFAESVPRFLGAVIIFIVGWLIAKIVAFTIKKILKTIGVDRIAEKLNEIEFIEKANFKVVPSTVLSKIAYYLMLLVFTIVAAEYLAIDAVSDLVKDILTYIPNLIAALVLLVIGLLLAQFIQNILTGTLKSLGVPSAKLIGSVIFYFIFLMSIITALTQIGIDTDFISTNLSIIIAGGVFAFSLGYGLASKGMMANFLASLYSKEKIRIGDVITVNGVKGEVLKMDSSSVTLLTDNSNIIIPLSKLTSETVEIHDV